MDLFIVSMMLMCGPADDVTPSLVRRLDLVAEETFVQFWPADGFLWIKEYRVGTLKKQPAEIRDQISQIGELVRSANYSKSRYGWCRFVAMEERMYRDRTFVTIECRLVTRERNLVPMMEDVFSSILNRRVAVTIGEHEVGLQFRGIDVDVRSGNAETFAEADRRVMFWRNGERFYEAVFAQTDNAKTAAKSIEPYFERDTASPAKSQAEIRAWRDSR